MIQYAILIDKQVIPTDFMTWAEKFETSDRIVQKTYLDNNTIEVSTVFLGLNHGFGNGTDKWFETMIFGGEHDQDCWRWTTYEQAELGHKQIVDMFSTGMFRDIEE